MQSNRKVADLLAAWREAERAIARPQIAELERKVLLNRAEAARSAYLAAVESAASERESSRGNRLSR